MGVIINAVILYVLVSVLGDSSEASTRWKVLAIALGLVIVETAVSTYITNLIVALLMVVVIAAAIAVVLEKWCRVSRNKAIQIAAIFLGLRIVVGVVLLLFLSR